MSPTFGRLASSLAVVVLVTASCSSSNGSDLAASTADQSTSSTLACDGTGDSVDVGLFLDGARAEYLTTQDCTLGSLMPSIEDGSFADLLTSSGVQTEIGMIVNRSLRSEPTVTSRATAAARAFIWWLSFSWPVGWASRWSRAASCRLRAGCNG